MFEMIDLTILMSSFAFLVQPLINGSFANITDPITLLKAVNNSPAINGSLSLMFLLIIFIVFTFILSFRIMVINALLVASFISMIVSVLLNQIGLLASGYVLIFVVATVLFALISMVRGLLQPIT